MANDLKVILLCRLPVLFYSFCLNVHEGANENISVQLLNLLGTILDEGRHVSVY